MAVAIAILPDNNLQPWEVFGWLVVFAAAISLPIGTFIISKMFCRSEGDRQAILELAKRTGEQDGDGIPFSHMRIDGFEWTQAGPGSTEFSSKHNNGGTIDAR